MSLGLVLVVSLAGGIGAALRLVIDTRIKRAWSGDFPLGTLVVNVSGSLLLGVLTGLVTGALLDQRWQLIVGSGLLGGYTTFSTASFETVRLLEARRYRAALFNGFAMVALCVSAAAAGLLLGSAIGDN